VAQWIENPPGVREVPIPVGNSVCFFVPRSCQVDQFTFHILLPRLKLTMFIQLSNFSVILPHVYCVIYMLHLACLTPSRLFSLKVANFIKAGFTLR